MGYRHYLKLAKIKDIKKVNQELIDSMKDSEGWFSRYNLFEKLNFIDLIELGKYSDEGFELSARKHKIRKLKKQINLLIENCSDEDSDFNIITQEDFVWLIEKYKERTVNYWKMLLSDERMESYNKVYENAGDKCKYYVQNLLHWEKFLINTDLDNKWILQTTWKYEYELFNLLHIYKTIDWKNNIVFIVGG